MLFWYTNEFINSYLNNRDKLDRKLEFKLNFGFGIFVPVFKRVVLNVGYDHRPQSVFVGIAISGPFNYEDLDMW
jgi:hypothetical protein